MSSNSEEDFQSIYLMLLFDDDSFSIEEEKPKLQPISKFAETTSREILAVSEEKLVPGYVYYDLMSHEKDILYRGVFHDPIDLRVEFQPKRGSIRSTIVTHKRTRYAVTIPYFAKAASIRLKRVNRDMQLVDLGMARLKGHYTAGGV
jgi:hypothetical protein